MCGTQEQTVWPTSLTALRGTVCWACYAGPLNSALSSPSVPPWLRACKTSSPGMTFTTRPQYGAGHAGMYSLSAGGEQLVTHLIHVLDRDVLSVVATITWAWTHTGAVMAFYSFLQFRLSWPHVLGASDRGAQREGHHSGLMAGKWQALPGFCRTFWLSLRWTWLSSRFCSWDCPSLKRWLKTKTSANRSLMLQQSPYHSTSSLPQFAHFQFIPVLHVEENTRECSASLYYSFHCWQQGLICDAHI